MVKQYSSRTPLAVLTLCLCLGSLVISPMVHVTASSGLIVPAIPFENNDHSEQLEFDEELIFLVKIYGTVAELFSSKFRSINLDWPTADVAPVSPPPKLS